MNKKVIIIIVLMAISLALLAFYYTSKESEECIDIVGDGYFLGTDPEPVIIGNTCEFN